MTLSVSVESDPSGPAPQIGNVLSLLADALDEAAMRGLNLRVQEEGEPIERVAQEALEDLGLTQTIPSIALLAFMIPLLGVGLAPALVALWIYSIFPILRNTYTGVRDTPADAVQAASALGMTDAQVLKRVRLPRPRGMD